MEMSEEIKDLVILSDLSFFYEILRFFSHEGQTK